MNTNKTLLELVDLLEKAGHTGARSSVAQLVRIAQSTEAIDWQKVVDSVEQGYSSGTDKAMGYLLRAGKTFMKVGKGLKGVDPGTLKDAAKVVKKMSADMTLDDATLIKYSKLADYDEDMIKTAQLQVSDAWKASGFFGKTIPVIGVVFSFLLALKNLAFGIYEFINLINSVGKINLTWYQALDSTSFSKLAYDNRENPGKLIDIVNATQIAKTVWDEGISLIANAIDFIKDAIFLWIDIFSGGSSIVLDIGISVVIFILEMAAEESMLGNYDKVLEQIKSGAKAKVKELTPQIEEWWLEKEKEETESPRKWWLEEEPLTA